MIDNRGVVSIEEADEMNVPVNIFITEDDEDKTFPFSLMADNFMPRKARVDGQAYYVVADTREELVELVQKHVVPLYEAALHNLKTNGGNYYWEVDTES